VADPLPGAEPASAPTAARARVFFALWPDDDVAARLDALGRQLREQCRGRLTRRETLHLTLAFVGDVTRERIAELAAIAAQLQVPAFSLSLDVLGSWARNRIAWAGCQTTPQVLAGFAGELADRLRAAGFQIERRAFKPHLTLLRKIAVPFAPRDMAPVHWQVDEFVLVESVLGTEGARYRTLARWPLCA
jgi:2'-5' RNA ligase